MPTDHVYVRHISPVTSEDGEVDVVRLRDPVDPWWPPPALEPAWLQAKTDDFDVFHVHFGFDARSVEDLRDVIGVLRSAGRPLVVTVHDLRNPHHVTRDLHDAHLDVLVPAADALITLTNGAAAEISHRWGRTATVLPHPHVVELDEMRRRRKGAPCGVTPFSIGLHLKSLRPCMATVPIVEALLDGVDVIDDATLRIDVHRDVALPGGGRYDVDVAAALDVARARGARVEVHDYFSDSDLWDYLEGLDVSVLPYRYGTHSGWLEACRDLGTAVAAPDCGYYGDQGPVHSFHLNEQEFGRSSLIEAIRRAHEAGPLEPVSVQWRLEQRRRIADAHAEIYRRLLP